jgi:hypothetical protein
MDPVLKGAGGSMSPKIAVDSNGLRVDYHDEGRIFSRDNPNQCVLLLMRFPEGLG